MAKPRIAVECGCGWSGRRVYGECACYDEWAMSCACAFGFCPKCNRRVYTAEARREGERMKKFMASSQEEARS